MTIFVPKKNTSVYNMYANAFVINKEYDKQEEGTFITAQGVAVLFYKYPRQNVRQCYIITEHQLEESTQKIMPGVREKVWVLAYVKGKEIDILKTAIFNLEKIYGKTIYKDLLNDFWVKLSLQVFAARKMREPLPKEELTSLVEEYLIYQNLQNIDS